MKKTTFYKNIFVPFLFLLCAQTFGQVLKNFTKNYEDNLKGDILVIGNNILNRDFGTAGNRVNDSYDVRGNTSISNQDTNMKWINIDSDGGNNFNSSSAGLTIPSTSQACYEIVYAALYWSGTYVGSNRSSINTVRLKVPGSTTYKNLTGTVIYDYTGSTPANDARNPYACFKDITNDVKAAKEGTYTVANIACSEGGGGSSSTAGHSAGWTMFVVYKDPKLTSKYITTYDGFTNIRNGDPAFTVLVNGFKTNPLGPVKAKIAFAALEGDNKYNQDALTIRGVASPSTGRLFCALRPASTGTTNFFNSTINDEDVYFTNRTPNSRNTLGYDTGVIQLANPGNTVLKNGETGANITLSTGLDWYYTFFTALSVEIIEPKILLTKVVQNTAGDNIGNGDVALGDILNYVIQFQNVGNDNVTEFTIRDILPINTIFNYPADLSTLPTGITVKSYDATTREIIFNVDNSIVEVGDGISEIRLKVQVVPNCSMLSNACSNSIDNVAYATYKGTINSSFFISDDPSIDTNTGCILSPKATNFLVGIDDCTFARNEVLCGTSITLTAASGYSSYSWTSSLTGTEVLGTNQTLTISKAGIYYVHNTAIAPCLSINETITVTEFGGIVENPIISGKYADQLPQCTDGGKILPKIFLCGANASRTINTNISDGSTLTWEKLNEGSCTLVANTNCVTDTDACSWVQVATGPNYTADTAGQFRLTLNYPGGCFNRFYFVVYKNPLSPNYTAEDIICTSPGKIIIGGFPTGYEYSLSIPPDDPTTYQTSNEFSITTPNIYTAHIRQTDVTNGCVFTVPNIQIRQRTFTVDSVITPPLCHGGKGSVKLVANDVRPQYSYSISQGATLINSVGPIAANNYTFANLNAGTYTVNVSTEDCPNYPGTIQIVDPPLLQATANQTKPLTCTDGEVTVSASGGTPKYYYYVNSTTDFQDFPEIAIPSPGTYNIVVVDQNNCTFAIPSITIAAVPKPVYTVTPTHIKCYGNTSGKIEFNVTNANGYTLAYSIDDGLNYVASAVFSNLVGGTYNTKVRYTLGTSVCEDIMQPITINQPTSILTAAAGISELAGCGVPPNYGKARITNPQGGTPPYTYSFDGGNTYIPTNEAYIAPGTYTLYVQDNVGCIFPMPGIVLNPEPLAPTIVVSTPVFNCNGTATSTATVTSPPNINYSYNFFIDSNPNTNLPPNVFVNIPSGSHTISVEYKLTTVPSYSNLLFENFGYGSDTTSPGIDTALYCWEKQTGPLVCGSDHRIEDGEYSVTAKIETLYPAWKQPVDHTTPTVPPTPKGRFLVVNIGDRITLEDILYEKVINDIIPNQPINFEFFAMNLISSAPAYASRENVNLRIALVHPITGIEVAGFDTGKIAKTEQWEIYPKTPITLDPGSNTTLRFIIRSKKSAILGNDVAIDDIKVYQLPKICLTKKDFTIVIPSDMDFKASITGSQNVSCAGANDGTITIAAQNFDSAKGFDYSIDNGATWTNSLTSPVTRTGLANATYQIQVRYDNTATTCKFPFTQIIATPVILTSTATITTPAKCGVGATITASSTGGTLPYQYQLMNSTGTVVIRAYQLNDTFTNVSPGSYSIRAKDANNCTADINTPLIISPAPTPTATLKNTSDLCFDTVNQATFVVDVSGGSAPYMYSLDGAPTQSSNTFTNVGIGTHTIIVTDSFGCTAPTLTPVIATPLAVTNMQKGLNCTAAPDALITVNVTGGVSSFSYKVKKGAGVYSSSTPIVGSSFTYSITTANANTYTFEITDALGCTATTEAKVNPLVAITATTNVTPLTCNGSMNGAVTITPAGGVAPYTYSFDGSGFTSNATYSGLTASTLPLGFHYQVMDSKSCVFDGDVIVTQPPLITFTPVVTNMSCPPASILGSIALQSVTNGVAPFTYTLTNTVTNAFLTHTDPTGSNYTFTGISFGTYNLTVTDSKGCSATQTLNVLSPPTSLSINVSTSVVSCAAGATVIVSINPSPIPPGEPYTFGIYEMDTIPFSTALLPNDSPSLPFQHTFTGLTPGVVYTFVVYDSITGCYYFQTAAAAVAPLTTLKSTINAVTPATCKGASTGTVTFTVFGYTGTSIDYEVFHAQTNSSTGQTGTISTGTPITVSNFGAFAAGEYYIQFTELDGTYPGCTSASARFTITESAIDLTIMASIIKNANCNPNSGVISAVAQNGTAPYLYQLTSSVTPPLPSDPLWAATSTFNINAGGYYAHVKDAYGCIKISPQQTITTISSPVVLASIKPLNQCAATEGSFEIDVDVTVPAAGIPPYSFSIDGGTFESQTVPFVIANVSSGLHTVEVHDFNGCGNQASVTILPPLGLSTTITKLPSCSNNDGVITVGASGGTGAYNYSIIPNPVAPIPSSINLLANVFSGVPAGTYDVTITDTTTNCPKTVTVNLEAPTLIITDFSLTPIQVICYGGTDGSIIASIATPAPGVNDNPPYTYSLDGGTTTQPSNVFSNLLAGPYTVTVISGKGCQVSLSTTVTAPNLIGVQPPTVIQYGCTSDSNVPNYATITIDPLTITGGSSVYTKYDFIKGATLVQSGTNPAYIESDLSGGNYTINVYDDKGCPGTNTAIINPFISINNPTVTITKPITCAAGAGEEITVTVAITGGIPPLPLVYTVKDIVGTVYGGVYDVTNTSGSFTGLPIGDYKIIVYNPSTGCSVETTHQVNNPNIFDLQITKNSDVVCYGTNGGSVDLSIIDRTSLSILAVAFNYTITGPTPSTSSTTVPITISNLTAGSYTVTATLTDLAGSQCSVTSGFTIDGPTAALAITETHTPITCASNDGSISAPATGGWPGGYEYQLELVSGTIIKPWSTVYDFTGLLAENYRVWVRDSKGCPAFIDIDLDDPIQISIGPSIFTPTVNCFGDTTGSITVGTATGGQGSNYMYTLNTTSVTPNTSSGPQSSLSFNNLGAGTYTVTVTDGYSCSTTTTFPIIITEPTELVASVNRASAQSCITAASLTLRATGGTSPYTYSADGITYLPGTFVATTTFAVPFASAPTTYHYYVKDANGCTSLISNDIIINPLETLTIQLDYTNTVINCNGESTGVIVANAIGGVGSYVYTLLDPITDNPIGGATQTAPGYFTKLPAGSYKVKVVSGLDCSDTEMVTINEPPAFIVKPFPKNVLCNGFGNGEIKILADGGTPIIKYAISPQMNQFFDTGEFSPLNPGTYDVYTQDEKGCHKLIKGIVIIEQPAVNASINIMQQELCAGDKTGEFNIFITGGETPYATSLDNRNAAYTEGNFNFSGLAGGEHTVYVRDANGCESDWIAALDPAVFLNPKANATYDCVDDLPANIVTVTIDPSNTNPSLIRYSLDGNPLQPSNLFTNVPPGSHLVSVKHNNGCEDITDPFPVVKVEPLTISINLGALNQIVATTTGGSGVYQYAVNDELIGSTNTYIYYKSGNYTFTVTDSNGCSASASKQFDFIDIDIPNVFTPNGNGTNDNWQPTKTENYPDIKFIVYDRYGREVGTFGSGQFWDGKYNGTELPTGDYWYILKLNNTKDDREFVGHFTLYR